jgi:hypothetical protein
MKETVQILSFISSAPCFVRFNKHYRTKDYFRGKIKLFSFYVLAIK